MKLQAAVAPQLYNSTTPEVQLSSSCGSAQLSPQNELGEISVVFAVCVEKFFGFSQCKGGNFKIYNLHLTVAS